MVVATDGASHTPAIESAHRFLMYGVGGAFAVGFVVAILVYGRGLRTAESLRRLPVVSSAHTLLVQKYYIDELYDLVWVKGCVLVAAICRFVDTYFVDLIFDTSAKLTERLAAFSGLVVDNHGVDGIVNGVAKTSIDFAGVMRSPQTGRIRNYVLFALGAATVVIVVWLLQSGSFEPGTIARGAAVQP